MNNQNQDVKCKKTVNRNRAICLVLLMFGLSSVIFAASIEKPRFYLKFKGIGTPAGAGSYGDMVDLNQIYFADLNQTDPQYTVSFEAPSSNFIGYSGEFGFETKKFSIGFSGGYMEKSFQSELHYEADDGLVVDYTREQKFSAIPLFLFIRYKVINTRFFTGSLTVGEGVYLTTYKDERVETYENYDVPYANLYTKANKSNLGFHIGVTLDFNVTSNIAISMDGGYRIAKLKDITAEYTYEDENGILDPVEDDLYLWTNTRNGEARLELGEPSENKIYWEGLPAEFDLSGFTFSIGLKITFGSGKEKEPVKIAPQGY